MDTIGLQSTLYNFYKYQYFNDDNDDDDDNNRQRKVVPSLPVIIIKSILDLLFRDHRVSILWKVRSLSLVSRLFFNVISKMLTEQPHESLEIKSMISFIGSEYCLFKSTPLHLNDYEIMYIPEAWQMRCQKNLKSLTHTRIIDMPDQEYIGSQRLINILNTSQLEKLSFVECTTASVRGKKFTKVWDMDRNHFQLLNVMREADYKFYEDLEKRGLDSGEYEYGFISELNESYIQQLIRSNTKLKEIYVEYVDSLTDYSTRIVDYVKIHSKLTPVECLLTNAQFENPTVVIYSKPSEGYIKLRQLVNKDFVNEDFGDSYYSEKTTHLSLELWSLDTSNWRLVPIMNYLFIEPKEIQLKRLDLTLLNCRETIESFNNDQFFVKLNSIIQTMHHYQPFKTIELFTLSLQIKEWDSPIKIPIVNQALVEKRKIKLNNFEPNNDFTEFKRSINKIKS
ncbi:hypothetical protein PPL_09375 [Heterostelium album PN500]|uniref:F-box domain-containing protein n=1 Tax=Heterostelium pallidum (strain ATCC 26659 / Pp 5 / PN500) TaxID=670386 RepID=D3BLE1_HETP5|nr:hypothetical protein PPL_09375 [Heterostelium album PN500]EFA77875.1 hypothetical protein PPL_09375 [Heterostelium album PN500]|eukprot:XP_020430003.1 hypothetical protein PPL_09375 [Heterostelium album PN500]